MPTTDRTGIQRHGAGWRATVSCGRSRQPIQKHFPLETPLRVMQAWRADTRAALRLTRKQRATSGTFAYDAARYLASVTALQTHAERTLHINRWVAIFGLRQRDTITSTDIRRWRDRWMTEPRRDHGWTGTGPKGDTPYAASTINHWLRALSNLWTVLDGRRAPNPVRDVPEVTEPDALPRAIDYATIEQIIGQIGTRKDTGDTARTALRLRVLAYTGLTYAQLGRMQREDVDLEGGTMLVRSRRKGRGAKPRRLSLLPQAVAAFAALDAAGAWGPFSGASIRKSFLLAARKVGVSGIRPYDLRHSFGTVVYRATQSREAVRELLSHGTLKTTERYTLDAVDDVVTAQLRQVSTTMPHRR